MRSEKSKPTPGGDGEFTGPGGGRREGRKEEVAAAGTHTARWIMTGLARQKIPVDVFA